MLSLRLAPATVGLGHGVRRSGPPRSALVRLDRSRRVEEGLHDPPGLLDHLPAREERLSPRRASTRSRSYGPGGSPSSSAKSRSSETGWETSLPGVLARTKIDTPGCRPIRRTMSSWPGESSLCTPHCSCGTRWRRTTTSVAVPARAFPARTRIGTPAQRQFSISRRRATNVSVSESGARPRSPGSRGTDRARRARGPPPASLGTRPARRRGIASASPRGRLHRDERQDLQQVVLHDVAQRADRVVERAPVLDAEVLGHRDLDRLDVLAVPERLEEGVREAEVHDVLHRLLAQEVVDPEEALLGEDRGQTLVQLACGGEIGTERLLDDEPGVRRRGPRAASSSATSRNIGAGSRGRRPGLGVLERLAGAVVARPPPPRRRRCSSVRDRNSCRTFSSRSFLAAVDRLRRVTGELLFRRAPAATPMTGHASSPAR